MGRGGVRSRSAFWASPGPENNTDVHHLKRNLSVLMCLEPDKRDHLSVWSFSDEGGVFEEAGARRGPFAPVSHN